MENEELALRNTYLNAQIIMPTPPIIKPLPEIIKKVNWVDKTRNPNIQFSSAIPDKILEENSNIKIDAHNKGFIPIGICNKNAMEEYADIFKHMYSHNNLYNNTEIEYDNLQEIPGNFIDYKIKTEKGKISNPMEMNNYMAYMDTRGMGAIKSNNEISFKNQAKNNTSPQKIKAIKSIKPANNPNQRGGKNISFKQIKNRKNIEDERQRNINNLKLQNNRKLEASKNKRSSSSMSNEKYDFSFTQKNYLNNEVDIKNNFTQYKIDFGQRKRNCVTPSSFEDNLKEKNKKNDVNGKIYLSSMYSDSLPLSNSLSLSSHFPEKSQHINIVKFINKIPKDKRVQVEIIDTLNGFRNKPVKPSVQYLEKWGCFKNVEKSNSYL